MNSSRLEVPVILTMRSINLEILHSTSHQDVRQSERRFVSNYSYTETHSMGVHARHSKKGYNIMYTNRGGK